MMLPAMIIALVNETPAIQDEQPPDYWICNMRKNDAWLLQGRTCNRRSMKFHLREQVA
jgi:hypothetical protein